MFKKLAVSAVAVVVLAAAQSFAAHSSGIFINANISAAEREGDGAFLVNDEGPGFPDTSLYDLVYRARYSFAVGYEHSFSKYFSARAALGYQNVLMNQIFGNSQVLIDGQWVSRNDSLHEAIERHWLTIPIEGKAMLPFRRSGVYAAAGPKISILMASKFKNHITGIEENLVDSSSVINFQLGFRLGWETAIANVGYFYIETGYHTGLVGLEPLLYRRVQVWRRGNSVDPSPPYEVWRHDKKYREGEAALGVGFRINFPTGQ